MEIRAKDLMIGDWVNFMDGPKKVVDVGSSRFCVEGFPNSLGFADPIPLTPEILEKNGFTSELDCDIKQYVSKDCRIILQDDDRFLNSQEKWYVHVDSLAMSTIGCCELTYVHELQHFLKLCKIETDLVL